MPKAYRNQYRNHRNVACSDPDEWNRYEAVNIIGRLRITNMLSELVSLLESAPDIVKAGILDVLGELGDNEHRKIIEMYAKSENPLLKDAAMEALGMKKEEGRRKKEEGKNCISQSYVAVEKFPKNRSFRIFIKNYHKDYESKQVLKIIVHFYPRISTNLR